MEVVIETQERNKDAGARLRRWARKNGGPEQIAVKVSEVLDAPIGMDDVEAWMTGGMPSDVLPQVESALGMDEGTLSGSPQLIRTKDPRMVRIGRTIRSIRKSRGMTQVDLALKIHKEPAAYSKNEIGFSTIDILEVLDIAQALGVSVGRLVDEVDPAEQASRDILDAIDGLSVSQLNALLQIAKQFKS